MDFSFNAAGPPVDCEYSAFGPWSECSRRCGGGFRSRERSIQILARRGGKPCRGGSRETQICNKQPCPRKMKACPEPDRRKRRTRRDIVEHTVVPTAVNAIYVLARRINILLLILY